MRFLHNGFAAVDIIAIVVILSMVYLKMRGMDGDVSMALLLTVGYYFGIRTAKIAEPK